MVLFQNERLGCAEEEGTHSLTELPPKLSDRSIDLAIDLAYRPDGGFGSAVKGTEDLPQEWGPLIVRPQEQDHSVLDFGADNIYANSDAAKSSESEPTTIVIVDKDVRPLLSVGVGAHYATEVASFIKQLLCGDKVIDNPQSPKEIVDKLLAQSQKDGKPLSDIVIECHGCPGYFYIGNKPYRVDDPEVLKEFARLKGHMAPGARIIFTGCEMGAGDDTPKRLQRLANAAGVSVVAFKWYQLAGTGGIGPKSEATPVAEKSDKTAHHKRPARS